MKSLLASLLCCSLTVALASAQQPNPGGTAPREDAASGTARESGPERSEAEEPEESLETDRDSFTPATKTVDRHRSILETSYSFLDNRRSFETHSFPEILYRYGITDRIELRLGWNYEVGGAGSSVSGPQGLEGIEGGGVERESRVLYGFKTMLTDQRAWVPQSSFVVQGHTPTSGKETDSQVNLCYVFGWKLPNRWKLDTAFRYGTGTAEHDHFVIWAPSTVLRVPLGERWAVHAEYFGLYSQQKEANFTHHFFSPGVHYLVNNNLEVGIRVGWGLNDQSSRFFSNVGLGWRF